MTATTPRVLCFVPYGSWHVHNQVDGIIGTALLIRGAIVTLLTCDGIFQDDCYVLAHSKNQIEDCKSCILAGQQFLRTFPLPLEQLRPYTKEQDWEEIETWLTELKSPELSTTVYKGFPVGEWARTSVRSYHVVNPRNLQQPQVQALFRKYIKYAWVTYCAAQRFFDKYQPTHLCMFGGYGFLHAPLFNLAISRSCKVITHERGQLQSRFMVASDDPVDSMEALSQSLDAWGNVPLTNQEFTVIRSVFMDWEQGKNRMAGGYYTQGSEEREIKAKLGIPLDASILVAFTSGEHELATLATRQIGGQQLELISMLIEEFRGRPEYLVIRHHPNLGVGVRSRLDYDYLTRAYQQLKNLPPNVRIVMPNESITSYAILWNSAASIAFMSTLAMESVARGVPTATLTLSGFERLATYVIRDFTRSAMAKLITALFERADQKFSAEDLRKAYTFARAQHLKYSTLFKSFGIKNTHEADLRIESTAQLAPGIDSTLDRICDFVMKGTSIYDLPTDGERVGDRVTEKRFLEEELAHVRQRRKEIRESLRPPKELPKTCIVALDDSPSGGNVLTRSELYRQRKAPFEYHPVTISEDWVAILQHTLQHSDTEFALVTTPRFIYDEAFLATSLALLETSSQVYGIRHGAWIENEDRIVDYLFTVRHPVDNLIELDSHFSEPLAPWDLLGFAVFRRDSLLDLLSKLTTPDSSHLFAMLTGAGVFHHSLPTLRIGQGRQRSW